MLLPFFVSMGLIDFNLGGDCDEIKLVYEKAFACWGHAYVCNVWRRSR